MKNKRNSRDVDKPKRTYRDLDKLKQTSRDLYAASTANMETTRPIWIQQGLYGAS
jgi:hypothetical protein